MINKENWKLIKEYLDDREHVDQIAIGSLKIEKTYTRYILEWAKENPFLKAPSIRPTLPEYMLSARLDGKEGRLSAIHIKKVLATGRRFFTWLAENNQGYRSLKQTWINSLKAKRLTVVPQNKDYVSLDEILAIAKAPVENLIEKRIRAAAVFLYLSGMRISAFVSLSVKAVDISKRVIIQDPNQGVRTKNRKYAVTYLLDIPELLAVIQDWDNEIREQLPNGGFWFAPFLPDSGEIDPNGHDIGVHRENLARKNLHSWLSKVGLPYHSPHKFRHGHIHFGLNHAESVADFKAVSLNAMHSSMEITDQFYSVLNDSEVKDRIGALGKTRNPELINDQETYKLFHHFLEWVKINKAFS